MSRLQTPETSMPSTSPILRAVTSPTRNPVNGPGPTPTAIPVRSRGVTPADSSAAAIAGASNSPWRSASTVVDEATISPVGVASATVTAALEVSKASNMSVLLQYRHPYAGRRPARTYRRDPQRPRLVGVVVAPGDHDLDAVLRQRLRDAVAPFDHRDRILQARVLIQVVQLGESTEPVGVNVHQRRPAGQRRMHPRDDEGRRGHSSPHLQPDAESLGERRLARAEVARQDQEIA